MKGCLQKAAQISHRERYGISHFNRRYTCHFVQNSDISMDNEDVVGIPIYREGIRFVLDP